MQARDRRSLLGRAELTDIGVPQGPSATTYLPPWSAALAFATIVALLDLVIVAGVVLHGLAMFGSFAGTWLPLTHLPRHARDRRNRRGTGAYRRVPSAIRALRSFRTSAMGSGLSGPKCSALLVWL